MQKTTGAKRRGERNCVRRKEAALGENDGDVHFGVGVNLAQEHAEVVVVLLVHGVELGGIVDGDDGDAAAVLETDNLWSRHDVCVCV